MSVSPGVAAGSSSIANADPVNEGVLQRARFLAACRGVADVAFGLETGRQEYIQAGIPALGFFLGWT